jgi:hypothetical protein
LWLLLQPLSRQKSCKDQSKQADSSSKWSYY